MNEVRAVGTTTPIRALQKTLAQYLVLYASLLLLALICLSWSLLALPLYLLLPRRVAIGFGRYGIMVGFRLYAYWLTLVGAYRLDLSAVDSLRGGPAVILAPNHPSIIDAILILTRHPDLACVMKSNLMDNILFGPGARLARYINNSSTLRMVREAVADLKDGGTAELKVTSLTVTRGERVEKFLNIARMSVRAHRGIRILAGHCSTTAPFCQPLFRGPRSSFKHLA